MLKSITFLDQTIAYTFRQSRRARRMRLAVHGDGSVVVTAPVGLAESVAERFIREKAAWLMAKLDFFRGFVDNPISRLTRKDYLAHKGAALAFARKKVEALNRTYGYHYRGITVRNQRTRWGSCSQKGNLSFNYKILFLGEEAADYIVTHELCHLAELNHSKKFWALVARSVPDYAAVRKELRGRRRI